jgi:hypothetical protein
LALRKYQEQAALKAQQQAFANEIATREAEAKFGGRSYNQDISVARVGSFAVSVSR